MNDPFPAIAEASATGETADLFADIRATVGVRVVNLVWRHLATLDGALPWAWRAVKPLYLAGHARRAARRFRETMAVPKLGSLAGDEPASVDAVLASYDHSNTINLFALGALVAWLRGEAGGDRRAGPARACRRPMSTCRSSPRKTTSRRRPGRLVQRLNRFGDRASR